MTSLWQQGRPAARAHAADQREVRTSYASVAADYALVGGGAELCVCLSRAQGPQVDDYPHPCLLLLMAEALIEGSENAEVLAGYMKRMFDYLEENIRIHRGGRNPSRHLAAAWGGNRDRHDARSDAAAPGAGSTERHVGNARPPAAHLPARICTLTAQRFRSRNARAMTQR